MNIIQLVEHLNNLQIHQKSYEWEEDLPEEIYKEYFEDKDSYLVTDLNVDKRRWYETSETIIEIPIGILGIRLVTNTFSEAQMIEDCEHHYSFFLANPVETITYVKV